MRVQGDGPPAQGMGRASPGPARLVRRTRVVWLLRVLGLAAVLLGAQIYAGYHHLDVQMGAARAYLDQLVEDRTQFTLRSKVEQGLAILVWAIDDGGARSEALRIQQGFAATFPDSPLSATTSALAALADLATPSPRAATAAARLRADLAHLAAAYSDHYGEVLRILERPPLYLWPAAGVWRLDRALRQGAMLNRALYLSQIGEGRAARTVLNELQSEPLGAHQEARVSYLLARLNYDEYRADPQAESYRHAVRHTEDSLRADPGFALAKRFLEFLLSSEDARQRHGSEAESGGALEEGGGERSPEQETPGVF